MAFLQSSRYYYNNPLLIHTRFIHSFVFFSLPFFSRRLKKERVAAYHHHHHHNSNRTNYPSSSTYPMFFGSPSLWRDQKRQSTARSFLSKSTCMRRTELTIASISFDSRSSSDRPLKSFSASCTSIAISVTANSPAEHLACNYYLIIDWVSANQ